MMKIECPECKKSFIWTDDMPVTGTCPTEHCGWQYNVHEQLKINVEKKLLAAQGAILCPYCGKVVASRWTVCKSCGRVVAGSRTFEKKKAFITAVLALLLASLIVRLWDYF